MKRIYILAFAFRLEHCEHHPGVFQPEGSRGSSSSSMSRGAAASQSRHLAQSEPTGARLELGHLQGPLPTQTTLWFHRTSPSTPGHGPCWFDDGFHGRQTDQQTPTLLTAVKKQTKEISLEIEVILKFTSKTKKSWHETVTPDLADSSWDWFLRLKRYESLFLRPRWSLNQILS